MVLAGPSTDQLDLNISQSGPMVEGEDFLDCFEIILQGYALIAPAQTKATS